MFEKITPEQAGISSRILIGFIKKLEEYEAKTHAIFMAKDDIVILTVKDGNITSQIFEDDASYLAS